MEIAVLLDQKPRAISYRAEKLGICFKNERNKIIEHTKKFKENFNDSIVCNILIQRFNAAKSRAKRFGLEFNITKEFLMELYNKQKGLCFYTEIKMETEIINRNKDLVISVDRENSDYGYTLENTILCCNIINIMKHSSTINNFIYFCQKVIDRKDILLK